MALDAQSILKPHRFTYQAVPVDVVAHLWMVKRFKPDQTWDESLITCDGNGVDAIKAAIDRGSWA